MTAEEAFAEAMAELDRIVGIRISLEDSGSLTIAHSDPEPAPLRILPAEEPKKEASTFGVCLGLLTLGGSMMVLAGMKLFDILWRLTR